MSYENIKWDKGSAFFNFPVNKEIEYYSFKNQGGYFNMPTYQYNNTSHVNIEWIDILPKNSYNNVPFVNGEKVDFELENKNNFLYHTFFLSFDCKNEHDTQNLTTIQSPLWIEKISLLKNGNEISWIDSTYIWLKNLEKYNPTNSLYYEDTLNVDSANLNNSLVIAPNTTKNFMIELFFSLRKWNILSVLPKNLNLRVKFRKNITNGGTPTDSDIIISNLKLVCKYLEVQNNTVNHVLGFPKIDNFYNKPLFYNRILNNLTSGTETYIDLDIKHNISMLKIFLTDTNATNANLVNFYNIKDFYINDSSGINILNGKKITDIEHKQNLYDIYDPVNKYYFYRKKNNIYIVDFTANNDVSDSSSYVSCHSFKNGIYRLYFVPTQTVATSVTVNVIAYVPSLITVKRDGDYVETYN